MMAAAVDYSGRSAITIAARLRLLQKSVFFLQSTLDSDLDRNKKTDPLPTTDREKKPRSGGTFLRFCSFFFFAMDGA